ncbi:hypothetical protein PT2222_260018 [Paraburkholderia tropica]
MDVIANVCKIAWSSGDIQGRMNAGFPECAPTPECVDTREIAMKRKTRGFEAEAEKKDAGMSGWRSLTTPARPGPTSGRACPYDSLLLRTHWILHGNCGCCRRLRLFRPNQNRCMTPANTPNWPCP